jgi:hypothetical protein
MQSIWMGIAPGAITTRVLAMAGASETILKARLSPRPAHPRAMATLLEAVALWQGVPVRAALSADSPDGTCDATFCREAFSDFGGPLYTVDWVPGMGRGRRRRRDLGGLGDFADLRQLLLFEVAR